MGSEAAANGFGSRAKLIDDTGRRASAISHGYQGSLPGLQQSQRYLYNQIRAGEVDLPDTVEHNRSR